MEENLIDFIEVELTGFNDKMSIIFEKGSIQGEFCNELREQKFAWMCF